MITVSDDLLKKHETGITAALRYYVHNLPTGLSDYDYDILEQEARKDGLELRDYATQFIQGKRSLNADYIRKVEKLQVTGNMMEAMREFLKITPQISYWTPKLDGSSVCAYYDPDRGRLLRVVTIGGSNLGSEGIDQTEKLAKFFPDLPGTGIIALHCECLVALEKGLGESSRQKANGLINSSYQPLPIRDGMTDREYQRYLEKFEENHIKVKAEIDDLLTLRCFRYYLAQGSPLETADYREVLESLPKVYNNSGDIKFSGALVFDPSEAADFVNHDIWATPTGTFLVDGVVGYTARGECVKALKYKDSGRGETAEVLGIQWNNQASKGKDSWSANALITPVQVRGVEIKKPTVGSIKKMVESGLSKGARVTVILANSTIPQVSKVLSPGNGDYSWPTCSCGYTLGPKDIYGTLAKCGNLECSERLGRMRTYLRTVKDFKDIDLNKLLVIDRFDWGKKIGPGFYEELWEVLTEDQSLEGFLEFLGKYLTTDLQKRNLDLVSRPALLALLEYVSQ